MFDDSMDDEEIEIPAFAVGDGRLRAPSAELGLETLVALNPENEHEPFGTHYREIARTISSYGARQRHMSITELAGRLGWPTGSVIALVTDLRQRNRVIIHKPARYDAADGPPMELLEKVLEGIRNL